jgi:isoleucyl-tRNA synthetase
LTGLDRWILGEFSKLEAEVLAAYDQYEFHVVYQKLSQFIAVELSSVYHDVIKDRLYTDAANSPRRRSTQTALHRLVTGLCQMLAPILAFTADEAWEFIPGKPTGSVHEAIWKPISFPSSDDHRNTWSDFFAIRKNIVLPELEKARQGKVIGKSLDAQVVVGWNLKSWTFVDGSPEKLQRTLQDFGEILGVSKAVISASTGDSATATVTKADGHKCERCWHWETDIGQNAEHPTICGRCVEAVRQFALK